jgi:hypothetical protein
MTGSPEDGLCVTFAAGENSLLLLQFSALSSGRHFHRVRLSFFGLFLAKACNCWVVTQSEFRPVLALNLPYGNQPLSVPQLPNDHPQEAAERPEPAGTRNRQDAD